MIRIERQFTLSARGDLSAAWLTAALRDGGHLPAGEVSTLAVELWQGKRFSNLYRLQATYSQDVPAPTSFILKLARRDDVAPLTSRRRWKEHEFYARVAPVMADPPVPRLYAAAYDADTGYAHLLLEDLSATHWGPPSPLPPTPEQLRDDVASLAEIHTWWWDHPDLGAVPAERDEAWIATRTAGIHRRLERFLAEYGDYLPQSARSALKTAAAAWPAILRRSADMPLTVVHGDAHPWNFLTPHESTSGRTCLLDWEGWSIEPGPHDLASLIALHLPVGERRRLEDELLERYVARLHERGVVGYDLSACRDDYRRAIARRVLSPVGLWSRGANARSWWPALEHISAAFHDLRCEEAW